MKQTIDLEIDLMDILSRIDTEDLIEELEDRVLSESEADLLYDICKDYGY